MRDKVIQLQAESVVLQTEEVGEGDDKRKVRTFRMVAYTGAAVQRFFGRAIFDLDGLEHGDKVPMLFVHDDKRIVGFADKVELGEELVLSGSLSNVTQDGRDVGDLADEGFPWQGSIGIQVGSWEELEPGTTETVNGREVVGPISIGRKSRLLETSFLPSGADGDTSAEVMSAKQPEAAMDPKAFAEAHPEAVQAWKDEGGTLAATKTREDLTAYLGAFPGREAWAAKKYAEGLSLLEAKAALSDVLTEELAAAKAAPPHPAAADPKAAKAAADAATLAKLEAKTNHPGVGFDGPGRQEPKGEVDLSELPDSIRWRKEWLADKKLQAEFLGNLNSYMALKRHEQKQEQRGRVA